MVGFFFNLVISIQTNIIEHLNELFSKKSVTRPALPGIRFNLHRCVVHSKQAVLINTVYRMEHNGHIREIIGRIINNCGFSGILLSAL